jgi:hypothetical protein
MFAALRLCVLPPSRRLHSVTECRGFGILKEVYEIFAHKFPLSLEEFAPTMEAGCRLINYRLMTNDGTLL